METKGPISDEFQKADSEMPEKINLENTTLNGQPFIGKREIENLEPGHPMEWMRNCGMCVYRFKGDKESEEDCHKTGSDELASPKELFGYEGQILPVKIVDDDVTSDVGNYCPHYKHHPFD
jgi:hypothetical protein